MNITEAKKRLLELIKAVEQGQEVTICRRGVPVVDLIRARKVAKKRPKLGTLRGRIKIIDPDWWKPMTDKEVEDFIDGRY
jgi:prevent-host-death family protein